MERFAEQDRLEQMNAQKRRLKVAQHAREVERLIQEKREMFEAAMVSIQLHTVNLLSYAVFTDCCTAGVFCCWACLATGVQMGGCISLSVLVIAITRCTKSLSSMAQTTLHSRQWPVNKQHSSRICSFRAVSSQMQSYCCPHDTCLERADLHCLHLMPAG